MQLFFLASFKRMQYWWQSFFYLQVSFKCICFVSRVHNIPTHTYRAHPKDNNWWPDILLLIPYFFCCCCLDLFVVAWLLKKYVLVVLCDAIDKISFGANTLGLCDIFFFFFLSRYFYFGIIVQNESKVRKQEVRYFIFIILLRNRKS